MIEALQTRRKQRKEEVCYNYLTILGGVSKAPQFQKVPKFDDKANLQIHSFGK